MEQIETLLVNQSKDIHRKQEHIKKLIYTTWFIVLIIVIAGGLTAYTMASTNRDLAEIIESRNAFLDYSRCRDAREDARNSAQTDYMVTFIESYIDDQIINPREVEIITQTKDDFKKTETRLGLASTNGPDGC